MRVTLCVLLAAASVVAEDIENRRTKLPYVADAVGNTLPPPSNVPATVGSPVNLLTPDRYEFYTFDESGELVKRLMTLEEIQAIVAAGEETEGLVTFANDNQPTVAFNFSQPPYTKVHSVVTNVQNVLKAQMEAHKNKPHTQPTLDTPDVSDSWSLILPSIFGNTGVDIVPDKTPSTFTTPETETLEFDRPIDDNSISKEGSHQILSSSTEVNEQLKEVSVVEIISTTLKDKVNPTTSTTTTTEKPKTTTIISPKTTITTTTTTTSKPRTTGTSTNKPTTTIKPTIIIATSTTNRPRVTTTTTNRPRTSSTTSKPRTTTTVKQQQTTKQNIIKTTPKTTTVKPYPSTKKQTIPTPTQKDSEGNFTRIEIQTVSNTISTTEKIQVQYEKLSTFIPVSTATYITERTTQKPVQTTKPSTAYVTTTKKYVTTTTKPSTTTTVKFQPPITTYKPQISTSAYYSSPAQDGELEKINVTTITTQSVAPSTSVPSTEYVLIGNYNDLNINRPNFGDKYGVKENEQETPLFDVAQSFSQIASDLGNYQPMPTTSDLLDVTRINDMPLESKENLEIDIPPDFDKEIDAKSNVTDKNQDTFIKISTLDPHKQNESEVIGIKGTDSKVQNQIVVTTQNPEMTDLPVTTTIDPVLSESMEDLLSQVVNQAPQSIIDSEKDTVKKIHTISTEKAIVVAEATINESLGEIKTTESSMQYENKTITKVKDTDIESTNISSTVSDNKIIEDVTLRNDLMPLIQDITNVTKLNNSADNKPEFVQILISNMENESSSESIPVTTSPPETNISRSEVKTREDIIKNVGNNTSKEETKEPVQSQDDKNKTEVSNKDELLSNVKQSKGDINSIKKVGSTLSQSSNSKLISVNNDKPSNNVQNKNTESIPKVEEFKKKIQKVNIDEKELTNERNSSWKLISTVTPPKANEIQKDKLKTDGQDTTKNKDIVLNVSKENQGLEITTKGLGEDVAQFTELCNELAFRYWHAMIENIDKKRSFVLSPYSITSMLAMMFMGARGATSGEMNEILKLDDMVTFNPHFILKNISDSMEMTPVSGVLISAFIREIFSDRNKGKILTFYKERAQHFYNGHVEEINFNLISDIIRRRTNLLVKRHTWGKIVEYMKANTVTMQPPLAAFSVNIFQTDCSESSVEGRDGEMYFVVSPNVRQRRLVPVPAVVYRSGFLAGYDPVLDATAASLGNSVISTLFLMPGQQGNIVHAEDLEALEKRLLDSSPTTSAWKRLLRTLLPRMGLELQIPRFSHKSIFNVSSTLRQMGLKDLFDAEHADLGGLIGPSKDLYLSDMIQSTTFVTCGGGVIGEQHHIEEYPEILEGSQRRRNSRWAAGWDEPRDYQRAFHDPHDVGEAMHLPLHLRPRQARLPARNAQPARLKFDRPFLFFVRHNPTGMILYVGRYNPRLLP